MNAARSVVPAVAAILVMGLAACAQPRPPVDDPGEAVGGSPAAAAVIVHRWLQAASTGSDDLGWSLLFPRTRSDVIRSEDVYRDAIMAADWSRFSYSIGEVETEDGEYRVRVVIQGGIDSVPDAMLDWGPIQFAPVDGVFTDQDLMTVRIDPIGWPWGIQATG